MKWLLFSFTAFTIAYAAACIQKSNQVEPTTSYEKERATCYGKSPCNACSSCNYCKHCAAGGKCGVCMDLRKAIPSTKKSTATTLSQCKATTKKGTRCSRSAKTSGYCWQHE